MPPRREMERQKYGPPNMAAFQPKNRDEILPALKAFKNLFAPMIAPPVIHAACAKINGIGNDAERFSKAREMRRAVLAVVEGAKPGFTPQQSDYINALLKLETITNCYKHPWYYVDVFGVAMNWESLGADDRLVPFILWPRQEELLKILTDHLFGRCACGFNDVVIDKNRKEGGTYLMVFFAAWAFLFCKQVSGKFMSLKEDKVDSSDSDCIFNKIRANLQNLPPWMMPAGWQWKSKDDPICSANMKLKKPTFDPVSQTFRIEPMSNSITGEATNFSFAISERLSYCAFDEFGEVGDNGTEGLDSYVWDKSRDSTKFRIAVSTPAGPSTRHTSLVRAGENGRSVHLFTLDWTDNPLKASKIHQHRRVPAELDSDPYAGFDLLRQSYEAQCNWDKLSDIEKKTWQRRWDSWKPRGSWQARLYSPVIYAETRRSLDAKNSIGQILTDIYRERPLGGGTVFESGHLALTKDLLVTDPNKILRMDIVDEKIRRQDRGEKIKGRIKASERFFLEKDPTGPISIFKKPDKDHSYMVTWDGSAGGGGNFAHGIVWCISVYPFEEVATFRSNTEDPIHQGFYLYALCHYYYDALAVPESNNVGQVVISTLISDEVSYFKIIRRFKENAARNTHALYTFGVDTQASNKSRHVIEYRSRWQAGEFMLRSEATWNDHRDYVNLSQDEDKPDFRAADGAFDDGVSSAILAIPGIKYLTGGRFNRLRTRQEKQRAENVLGVKQFDFSRVGLQGYRFITVTAPKDADDAANSRAARHDNLVSQ